MVGRSSDAATVDFREAADEVYAGEDVATAANLLRTAQDIIDRLRLALRSVDEPYPIDIFPDLQERDEVFAAMREINRYATEQFYGEIARQRGAAARSYLEVGDLEGGVRFARP